MSEIDKNTTNMVFSNTEFFTYESEIWYREASGSMQQIRETDYQLVTELAEFISTFYPKAYAALCQEYIGCSANPSYYRFRIIARFIRCNFSALDSTPDIGRNLRCTFEHVNCPLRGECKYDHVICRPQFAHQMSSAEVRVMTLVYDGLTEEEISERLRLSPLTIHTHVRNAYSRLGLHSKAEFIKYATQNNLFS